MRRLTDLVVANSKVGGNEGSVEVLAIQDPGVGWARNLIGLSAGSAGWTSCDTDTDTDTGSRGMSLSRKCAGLTLDLRSDVLRNLADGRKLITSTLEERKRTEEHTRSDGIRNEHWDSATNGHPAR
jgi:hypothetical protein